MLEKTIIAALRSAAVDAPTWHLTPSHRWQLLRDTLSGHVTVRGKIRPRDLPLDESCHAIIDAAAEIANLQAYKFDGGEILFRHWLAIFSLFPLATSQACAGSPLSADDQLCATIVELGFAMQRYVTRNADNVATSPFVHRLIGVLGLSQQEWKRLVDTYSKTVGNKTKPSYHDALLARWAARVVSLAEPPKVADFTSREEWRSSLAEKLANHERRRPELARFLAALDERACCYATLKADRPQQYINRGTRHWLLRGASGWCSQSLALARDLMCGDDDSLLFSDSDAIVGAWFPRTASQSQLQERLDRRLAGFWQVNHDAGMSHRFPRLSAWLRASLPEGVGLDREINLPSLSVRCLKPLSVLEICLYRILKEEAAPRTSDDAALADGSCNRVIGDEAVRFKTSPPWLQDETDDEATKVGITSMIWALCGTAFRTHAHEGLCTALDMPHIQLQAVKHGEWLQQLGRPTDSLVHLKIDGDGVGERFRTSSLADFPSLSLQLARMVQQRLVAGVRAALSETFPSERAGTERSLPVDVVYVGGDDVYVILPWGVLDSFLHGFSENVPSLEGTPWQSTGFTFVAARLKPKQELLTGIENLQGGAGTQVSDRFASANLAAARIVTVGLGHVKKDFRGEATLEPQAIQSVVDRALLRSGLDDQKMMVSLEPSSFDSGCLLADGRHLLRGRIFNIGPKASTA